MSLPNRFTLSGTVSATRRLNSPTSISAGQDKRKRNNEVSVEVTNTGSIAGDVVAQIYIHQRYGSASRPVRELKGFERVLLLFSWSGTTALLASAVETWVVEPSDLMCWPEKIELQVFTRNLRPRK
jgi:hypothetical protein